eukprot:TRINITY_DN6829_c0_g1_i1.p1 TRINITY_DN6829_c0_g1~~TRINITY_DN6829_c0_g1_i1.p1  ORF type:complete len:187 (+),score=27.98 TRINITY_DN6829_c0_g1_i1:299-859(+)
MLIHCSEKNYYNMVKILVEEKNADINQCDNLDNTALMIACYRSGLETVKYLVENHMNDLNYEQVNCIGNDCMMMVTYSKIAPELYEIMVQVPQIDINKPNSKDFKTPWELTVNRKDYLSMEILLSRDDLDVYNTRGKKLDPIEALIDNIEVDNCKKVLKLIVQHPSFVLKAVKKIEKKILKNHQIL